MIPVSITYFDSIKDNTTNKRQDFDSFDEYEAFLYSLSKRPAYKPSKDEAITPKCSPLITPAVYPKNAKRRNVNVEKWAGWAALDVDTYEGGPETALKSFESYRFVCYSTASSTKEHPKFRVVFPLAADVQAEKIKHFWYALNVEMKSLGDPQTKDLSRMYYIPGQYPGAYNFIFSNASGEVMKPAELMQKHAYITPEKDPLADLPEALQKTILEYRQNMLTNTSKSWTSYRDCPYMPQKQVAEYRSLMGAGWYTKLYAIMCGIASLAIKDKYPITATEIESLIRELDAETGGWYRKRPINTEAQRAINFVMRNTAL